MKRGIVVCLLVPLFGTILSGCSWQETTFEVAIGVPKVGDVAEYIADTGAKLVVRVVGSAIRYDGNQRAHDVVILEHVYRAPDGRSERTEEAIDVATGLLVQSSMTSCDRCGTDRYQIFLGSGGTAGGLGVGPLWTLHGKSGTYKSFPLTTSSFLSSFVVQDAAEKPGCSSVRLMAGLPDDARFGFMAPLQVIEGYLTLCEGIPLPTAVHVPYLFDMEADVPTTFLLDSYKRGSQDIVFGDDSTAWTAKTAIPLRGWKAPYFVYDDADIGIFPLVEAHTHARSNDSEYRTMLENSSDPYLQSTGVRYAGARGRAGVPLLESPSVERYYDRTLVLADSEGKERSLTLRKTIREQDDAKESWVSITEGTSSTTTSIVPNEILQASQVDPVTAALLSRELIGSGEIDLGFGFWWREGTIASDTWSRLDGYVVNVRVADEWVDGIMTPLGMFMDGPTGSILYFGRPSSMGPYAPDGGDATP